MTPVRVSEINQHFGLSDFSFVNQDILERSQDFGDAVHLTCRLWDENVLNENTLDEAIVPYLNAWKEFSEEFNPSWIMLEERLFSKVWNFTGQPDRYGTVNDKGIVVDIKTGAPSPSHAIQNAGYSILIEEELKIKVRARMTVYLQPDDYKLIVHKDRNDKTIFLSMLKVYQWKKERGLIK